MKRIVTTILSLLACIAAMGQTLKTDSTLVTFYPTNFDSISLSAPHYLDTSTFHANHFNPLENNHTLYSTLSNVGLAHHAMRFEASKPIGFDMAIPTFSQLIQTDKDLKTYLSLLPYSKIRYVMTAGDKEQHLNFQFGRQIYQGLYLSFEYDNHYSPGAYTNNKADNNYCWVNFLYTTQNQRYRALAYWFRNKIDVQENGGICYDSVYTNHQESDNSVILTNLNNASNYAIVSGAGFQHYFNLLPQFKTNTVTSTDTIKNDSISPVTTTDSITPRRFTLGRINHSFAYQRNKLFYNETSGALPFYAPYDTLLKNRTTDTTIIHKYHNSFTWNSLGYQKYSDNVPFYLYAGIDYDFYKIKHYDYLEDSTFTDRTHSQVILHGGVIMNLFGLTTITGHAQLVTLGYQIGDFDLRGQWRQRFGKQENHWGKDLTVYFDIDLKRQSPTWFETQYYSNHFRWENDFHAATYLTMDLHGQYKFLHAGVKNTTVNDFIYFGTDARPTQHDGIISISEIYGSASTTLWRFQLEGFFSLNYVSNKDVLHLPAFQSRLKVSFAQPIFKRAAILQPSITLNYFTKYYADAYMPALRTFYLQNDVLIGNYPFVDLALAINVKQADLFVQYSNMFLLTGNYNSFIAPHYPMRDSKIFFGINWRLFN
ncbi:MAG: hypothetical protein II887_01835 [Bacteroidales bacterium]|nr:hypothetical protein [Bacteroidales bacterium]